MGALTAAVMGVAVFAQTVGSEDARADPCPLAAPDGGFTSFVAWTAMFQSQPHHVAAPFRAELVAPITLLGICETQQWNSDNWGYVGMRGSDWIAKPTFPTPVQFVQGDSSCAQKLSGLSVMTAVEDHSALRLHFEGCDKGPSVVALRLTSTSGPSTGTGEPTITDLGILDFVCQVSPEECQAARARTASASPGSNEESIQVAKTRVGLGKCTGYGSQPHDVTDPQLTTKNACAEACQMRIKHNFEDPSLGYCTGYSWSKSLKSCYVYDGWPVTGADAAAGYVCHNMTALQEPAAAAPTMPSTTPPSTTPAAEAMFLDIAKVFMDPRAVTARRIQVSAFEDSCFPPFDWYIIDRWIHVSAENFAILQEMTKTNTTDARYLSSDPAHGGTAPRTNLLVERACIRDCIGALRAECKAQDNMGTPPGYIVSPDGSLVPETIQHPHTRARTTGTNMTVMLQGFMGEHAAETFTDREFLKWTAGLALFTLLLGGLLAFLVGPGRHKAHSQPNYQSVEGLKLIYEGDEEETVALRSTADGAMMSVTSGQNIGSSWTPSRAKANASSMGSKRALAWGTA